MSQASTIKALLSGRFFLILGILLLLVNQSVIPAEADTPITPDRIEATLKPEQCVEQTVSVTAGAAPVPKLDVALVIDVTSSMEDEIDEVTANARQMVADIRTLVPDTAFALATMSDYSRVKGETIEEYSGASDYPWQADQNFTKNETLIQTALKQIELLGGGDNAESYLRALSETQFLAWRKDSRRVVILFGDAPPHDPDPGRDANLGTADDLTQVEVINQLTTAHITILTVYSDLASRTFYEAIAEDTQGQAFALEHAGQIPQAVQQLIEKTVSLMGALTLEPSTPGQAWLDWEPEMHRDIAPEETRRFTVTLCAPADAVKGEYEFELKVTGDGAAIGRIPIQVNVLPRTANLSISQSSRPDPLVAGASFTYELIVKNEGPDPATGVVVEDALPANVILVSARTDPGSCSQIEGKVVCTLGSLAQNDEAALEIDVTPLVEGHLNHTAQVTGQEVDPNPANNRLTGEFVVNPAADLVITQTDYPGPVTAGQIWNHKFTVINQGPSDATGITLTGTWPQTVTLTLKAPGQEICESTHHDITCDLGHLSRGVTTTVELEATSLEGGVFTYPVRLTGSELDPDPANNILVGDIQITPAADVLMAITDQPDPGLTHQVLTYTVTLTNTGPSQATGIVLTSVLPTDREGISYYSDQASCHEDSSNLACTLNNLPRNTSVQMVIGIVPSKEGVLTVRGDVAGTEQDPDPLNNTATEETTIEAPWSWWWLIPLLLTPLLLWLGWLWRRKSLSSRKRPRIGPPPPLSPQPDPLNKPRSDSGGASIEHGHR